MDSLKETFLCAAIWGLFGFCAMSGAKAADWLIPNPPREPLKIDVRQDSTTSGQPAIKKKHPYVIG